MKDKFISNFINPTGTGAMAILYYLQSFKRQPKQGSSIGSILAW